MPLKLLDQLVNCSGHRTAGEPAVLDAVSDLLMHSSALSIENEHNKGYTVWGHLGLFGEKVHPPLLLLQLRLRAAAVGDGSIRTRKKQVVLELGGRPEDP